MDIIEKLTDALHGDGDPCDYGIDECDLQRYIQIAREINANKPIRAVKNWSWWNLLMTDSDCAALVNEGVKPVILNAHNLIYDNSGRFQIGCWVRTTLLVEFHQNAIFESKNTLYILVGRGDRKLVEVEIALAFF